MIRQGFVAVLAWLFLSGAALAGLPRYGHFEGQIDTRWLEDGRRMALLSDFRYIDPDKVVWEAPRGSVIDGASIPQIAWSFIGGPYEDRYRPASVIHDVACVNKQRPWDAVHLAFYRAMRASGVGPKKAKIMYAAVYYFGPRWPHHVVAVVPEDAVAARSDSLRVALATSGAVEFEVRDHYIDSLGALGQMEKIPSGMKEITARVVPPANSMTPDEFDKLQQRIRKQNLSLEQIRKASLAAAAPGQ